MNTTICLCLLCYKPHDTWINFLSTFTTYDIYIIIDDNSTDYKEQYSVFSNINIIQINDTECKQNGFINMNFTIGKEISAWEKSLYYFSTINTEYKKVWFVEDDVFFYDERSLLHIDSQYDTSDLLSNYYHENVDGDKNDWHWSAIDIRCQPPYYRAMVCCVRMSSYLLSKIRNYANEHNTLFFLEALFPTICKVNTMKYDTPTEFKNIEYRKNYDDTDIDEHNLFHPVKDIDKHTHYRNILKLD